MRGEVRRGFGAKMPLLLDGFKGSYFDPLLLQPLEIDGQTFEPGLLEVRIQVGGRISAASMTTSWS